MTYGHIIFVLALLAFLVLIFGKDKQ